jgi:hypothetical protein
MKEKEAINFILIPWCIICGLMGFLWMVLLFLESFGNITIITPNLIVAIGIYAILLIFAMFGFLIADEYAEKAFEERVTEIAEQRIAECKKTWKDRK